MSAIIAPSDGEYAQLFCSNIDMVGSELLLANTSPGNLRLGNAAYHDLVENTVTVAGGKMSLWHGDGNVAFFASKADEDPLIVHGEATSRAILDNLFLSMPEKKFRIGVGTAPIRYWTDVQTLNSPAIVLAARLQGHARQLARGSILLIPGDVHSALTGDIKVLYRPITNLLGQVQLYAYIPTGAGTLLPEPIPTPNEPTQPSTTPQLAPAPIPQIPPPAPGRTTRVVETATLVGRGLPFVQIMAYPDDPQPRNGFELQAHESWVMNHFLEMPIGTPIFRDARLRDNTLEVYVAEKLDGDRIQSVKFFPTGKFEFLDQGWSRLPDWEGVFYPQVLRSILVPVVSFAYRYFTECLSRSQQAFIRVEVGNIIGCQRKVQRPGAIPPKNFVFDRALVNGQSFQLAALNQLDLVERMYNDLILQSELDPAQWGYGTE